MRIPQRQNKQPIEGEINNDTLSPWASLPVWVGKLFAHTFDALALPELVDNIWSLAKRNSRALSEIERAEAYRIFADSLPYHLIRLDEKSLIARIAARLSNANDMGVATFHTINFSRPLRCEPGNTDMAWLMHELVHIAQMHHAGSRYMGEAIHAQHYGGYSYGAPTNLLHKKLCDFNREQQAEIIKDYYYYILFNRYHRDYGYLPLPLYESYIGQLQRGEL